VLKNNYLVAGGTLKDAGFHNTQVEDPVRCGTLLVPPLETPFMFPHNAELEICV
jgi:hypothetical protein